MNLQHAAALLPGDLLQQRDVAAFRKIVPLLMAEQEEHSPDALTILADEEIALLDKLQLRGEMQHAAAFLNPRTRLVVSDTDMSVAKGSDLAIFTSGAPGETRLDPLQRSVALFRKIVPPLAEHSPDAQTILTRYLADKIAPVDALPVPDKLQLRGEMLDLQHAAGFLNPRTRLVSVTKGKGSDLTIVKTRLNLLYRNVALFRKIMNDSSVAAASTVSDAAMPVLKPSLQESHSSFAEDKEAPGGILKRYLAGEIVLVGDHGDSSVAAASTVSDAGMPVLKRSLQESDSSFGEEKAPEEGIRRHSVVDSAYAVANLAVSLLRVHPVSVLATGFHSMSVTRGSDDQLAMVTAAARQGTRARLNRRRNVDHRRRHRRAADSTVTSWAVLFFFLCLAWLSSAACASRVLNTSISTTAGTPMPMPMPMPTAAFCGSTCCCSTEGELKLEEAFLNEVEAHGYHDAQCRSELKAYFCAVCLAPAPASDPFSSNTTNNSSLPLGCAAALALAPSSSGSIHDVKSEPLPTPDYWLPADDDNQASAMPVWLIVLISFIATLLTVLVGYTLKAACCNDCCNNNNFC